MIKAPALELLRESLYFSFTAYDIWLEFAESNAPIP